MPPHKPVKRLTDLALKASGECVYSYCKYLHTTFPCKKRSKDALSAPGCRESVQEVQDYMRGIIAPTLWDSVFQSVVDLREPEKRPTRRRAYYCDLMAEIFVLAVFIYDKVFLQKLRIRHKLSDDDCILQQRLRNFWFEFTPKLENLVEADISNVRCGWHEDDSWMKNIVLAFGCYCKNLQILSMDWDFSESTTKSIFGSCRQLRVLRGTDESYPSMTKESLELLENLERVELGFPESEDAIEQFDASHRFKLQSLDLGDKSPQQVIRALEQCPDLKDLHLVCHHEESCDAVYKAVASSSPKLRSLYLENTYIRFDALDMLLSSKGRDLYKIVIDYCKMRHQEILQLIGHKCPNLAELKLSYLYAGFIEDSGFTNLSFPNLQLLEVTSDKSVAQSTLIKFVDQVVKSAVHLTSLEFRILYFSEMNLVNESIARLRELFSSNPGVRKLQRVVLEYNYLDISLQLAQLIYEMCPELTYLSVRYFTAEAHAYFKQLSEEAKLNNLDFVVNRIH